jgi:4-hydroxybenzoate polyprenyltransferase
VASSNRSLATNFAHRPRQRDLTILFSSNPRDWFSVQGPPYIKSLLAPLVIAGILVVWPCIENGKSFRLKECLIFIWCMLILAINALVFDYRDIEGDAVVGTATIPVRLGQRNSIYLLAVLALALVGVSGWFATKRFVSPLMPATPGLRE